MSNETALVEQGPAVVRSALQNDDQRLNVDVLAQHCARLAHGADERDVAVAWARAAIEAYKIAAGQREPGVVRDGAEVIRYGIHAAMVLRWGPVTGDAVLDPSPIWAWVLDGAQSFGEPHRFTQALANREDHEQRLRAWSLLERLKIADALQPLDLVPREVQAWLEAQPQYPTS